MKITTVPISQLKPDPRNARKHSDKNIAAIKGSLTQFGQQKPIVVDKNWIVVAGNGTLQAASELGWKDISVVKTDLEPELARAYALADNQSSILAEWDDEILKMELTDLDLAGFDITDIGFDPIEGLLEPNDHSIEYSKKIEPPIYEPTGEKPKIHELLDMKKTTEIMDKIESSDLTDDEKSFLRFAAYRHTVFDYQKIAEFYAHSSKQLQDFFEQSALVIIDLEQAIERGFVTMTKQIAETYSDDI